ncbi:uncharacterized protein N7503_009283 [Penicillium pulvis]|uniref:uncharacterized protein n=1 Tax=Penicillium pulvis TaxID=1562058 RepID=UPI00254739E9|nr:uncharacterized protein N7503_009283 [Penicillium pulvis]KAJ5793305.1 hypothetical protein N7503_009283 [Penicillium pulvis]
MSLRAKRPRMSTDEAGTENEGDDFAELPDQHALLTHHDLPFVLPIPKAGESLEVTAKKLRSIADAIRSGGSLSLTKMDPTQPPLSNAEAHAIERMKEVELEQYEKWKQGNFQLPSIIWDRHRSYVDEPGMKTFSLRAAAMNTIWNVQCAVPENAVWASLNLPTVLPLMKAVTKLLTIQMSETPSLSESEIAEIQTLQLIAVSADGNIARERERVRQLVSSITESQAVLRERSNRLKSSAK